MFEVVVDMYARCTVVFVRPTPPLPLVLANATAVAAAAAGFDASPLVIVVVDPALRR